MYPNARPPPYELPGAGHELPHFTSQQFQTDTADAYVDPTATTAGSLATHDRKLDFPQRIERKLAEYNASQNVFKRWLFEIGSWLISAICMGAVIGIYIWLKDKPMSQVGQLLTYANILGKVASAALIVSTSEALGQLKWNWFHESKAMWDFEIFDKASRGPWGAVMLLFRTRGRSLAALGALLIVLLLAIDTFFQQVVDLPDRWRLEAESAIPRVVQYKPEYLKEYFQGWESQQHDALMYPNVRPLFYGNGTQTVRVDNGTRSDFPLICPTGLCTWPAYETLGVCSECVDASDLLEFKCLYTKIDWTSTHIGLVTPEGTRNGTVCGYFFDGGDNGLSLMSGYIVNATNGSAELGETLLTRTLSFTGMESRKPILDGSVKFKHVRNPVVDALIVSSVDSESVYQHKMPVAQECVLSWCVKAIESSYDSGNYNEVVKHTYRNETSGSFPWTSFLIEPDEGGGWWVEYNQNVTINRAVADADADASQRIISNDTYMVDNVTVSNVLQFIEWIFPMYYTDNNPSGKRMLRYKDYSIGAAFRELPFNPWQTPNNVTHHLERIATTMTNSMRSAPSVEWLKGAAMSRETYVSIRWVWLTFPLLLLVLSLVFLVSTIVKTSRDGATGVWKTSAMPTLIYSLPKETQGQFASATTWSSGKGAPRKTRIKLLPNMGWRVSGQSHLSRSPRLPSGARVPQGWV
ncbi:hypothetical protein BKA63DRAFT_599261 [Paraphoma chrysanthemicola]|nr:hypothetical protein BKA63DRAFT_599261 [Paraphoma chrysanthemicola]